MAAHGLSLAGEVLLLAIDPGRGGVLSPKRRRLRQALAAAHLVDHGGAKRVPGAGWRAARAARRELVEAGLVEGGARLGGLRLTDRAAAGRRFRQLRDHIENDSFPEARDRDLFVLLASSGALAARLSGHERQVAARRLRKVVPTGDTSLREGPPVPESVAALGVLGVAAGGDVSAYAFDAFDSGGGGGFDASGYGGGDSPQ